MATTKLIRYEAAVVALAKAERVDEVLHIRRQAEAVRVYAVQAKDTRLMRKAIAIRLRAERRAGELLAHGLRKRGRPAKRSSAHDLLSLDKAGISKNQSSHWQAIARVPATRFERAMNRVSASQTADYMRGLSRALVGGQTRRRTRRVVPELPDGIFRVLYADPPWRYDNSGVIGPDLYGRAERHFPTMSIDELCALDVRAHAADDAVLWLWVTSPILAECWPVIAAWGFDYKTSMVWDKVRHNYGNYVSVRHELLLICTRGSCLPDEPTPMPDSVVTEARTSRHSEKPETFRAIIDRLYPLGPRVELFARHAVPAPWEAYSHERDRLRRAV